jgi:hypothetical protein
MKNSLNKTHYKIYGIHMRRYQLILRSLTELIKFKSLSISEPLVTIYSEDKNYWPHLQGLLSASLELPNAHIAYVTSSINDPGLLYQHDKLDTFYIGKGFIRDYFFRNIKTDVMVMTMPDLNNYQIKRSINKVHYVYVQHSLVSLHMVYRTGAFDHYDTICAAGPHHVNELRKIIQNRKLTSKNIVKLGYSKFDSISENKHIRHTPPQCAMDIKTILIAPSWGANGLIETGAVFSLIEQLVNLEYNIILRPHPETIKTNRRKLSELTRRYGKKPNFQIEYDVGSQDSFYISDMMIGDWSGAAIEYALALNKPVIFCDVPRKINNPGYKNIGCEPIEVTLREQIGVIWDMDKPIIHALQECKAFDPEALSDLANAYVYNIGNSDKVFQKTLEGLLDA